MCIIYFYYVDNDVLLVYSKFDLVIGDCVLVVVIFNVFGFEEVMLWLDMVVLGMEDYDWFWVCDEIIGEEY